MTFDDEFDELAGLAYRVAFQIVGSRAEAEEIAQDTMTKAFIRWRRVQRHARPWVCRVAINGALGLVRRRRPAQSGALPPERDHQDGVANRLDLQRLLSSLSRRQRDVVALRYLADMSEADVANELGISVGSVKTHAHRGINLLRTHPDLSAGDPSPISGESKLERKEATDV